MNLCKRGLGLIHKSNPLHLRHPAEALVIDYEQHGRGQPRCGIAQRNGPVAQVRECHEKQQRQPQQAGAEQRQDRRHDAPPAAAHGGGQDLHAAERRIEKRQHGDDPAALGHDVPVVGEEAHGQSARQEHQNAEQRRKAGVHPQPGVDDGVDAAKLPRAEVLSGEGHDRNADGVGNRPEDAVELPVDRPRRDRVRAEQIDCLLDIDVRNVIKHAGNAGGKPDDEHALEQPPVRADFFEVQAVVSVRALQGADDQPRADEL